MTTFAPSVRPAFFSEQPRMAAVCTAAFWDDGLLAGIFHPHRKQYPKDVDLYWLRNFQLEWFNPRHHIIVSTVPDGDRPGKDLVVGVAHWARLGNGVKTSWNPLLPLMRSAMRIWVSISSWIWPDRAADPSKLNMFEESWPFIKHFWAGERAECWDLHLLAVHPSYGGRGIGKQLVKWGLNRAEREGVSASVKMQVPNLFEDPVGIRILPRLTAPFPHTRILTSDYRAPGVEPFYAKCGFHPEIVGWSGFGGDANPMSRIEGGNIYFKDPDR